LLILVGNFMEETIEKLNQYELGFHLIPDLTDEEVASSLADLGKIITKLKGNIVKTKDPLKIDLAYPIKHKKQAFFGSINLQGSPELPEELQEELKLNDNVLRFVILKEEEEGRRVLTTMVGPKGQKKIKGQGAPHTNKKREQEPVKPEEIEKQIDEVIKNI